VKGLPIALGLVAVSALGVARIQPKVAGAAYAVKETADVYVLPPPNDLKRVVFGYDAAAVDLLWAKLLVEYGTHWHAHVGFHPDPYLDAIAYLEPTYKPLYRFADTLLCYRPLRGTEADARKARGLLERGTHERPWDLEVWLEYGQFLTFLAPTFLTDATDAEKDAWRQDGARAIMRAVELGADARLGVSAATVLQRTGGARDAIIEQLKRLYAIKRDEPEGEEILRKLQRLSAEAYADDERRVLDLLDQTWRSDWPLLTKTGLLLVGPFPDPLRCAGLPALDDAACAHDWDRALSLPETAAEDAQ
jgi:hypothetical protein